MKRAAWIVVALVAMAPAFGLHHTATPSARASDSAVGQTAACDGYTDPDTPIAVAAGDEFSIALAANPTTGYSWQLAEMPDDSVVVPLGSQYIRGTPGLPGAGGTDCWSFLAAGSGEATITLNYLRPWEKVVPPARTVTFSVSVSE